MPANQSDRKLCEYTQLANSRLFANPFYFDEYEVNDDLRFNFDQVPASVNGNFILQIKDSEDDKLVSDKDARIIFDERFLSWFEETDDREIRREFLSLMVVMIRDLPDLLKQDVKSR